MCLAEESFLETVGGSSLVIGSISIGADTMVLRCFLLLTAPIARFIDISPKVVGSNLSYNRSSLSAVAEVINLGMRRHAP